MIDVLLIIIEIQGFRLMVMTEAMENIAAKKSISNASTEYSMGWLS
jgi:hypothetical protein